MSTFDPADSSRVIQAPDGRQHSIMFVGDYVPRQCGIATFTSDLCEAVAHQAGEESDVFALAVNDIPEGYAYPSRVHFEIRENVQADYRLAADFLNINSASVVCLQHEFGIYGGKTGSYVLTMLRRLRRPVVVTLHTVLKEPSSQEREVLKGICGIASRVVVMSDTAHEILGEVYDVPAEKIVTIHHGIPDLPFIDPNFYKDQFGVEGRSLLLTFGLLSPNKGIEYAIEALPKVVDKHPELMYVVLGATHPKVKRTSGEEYRNRLYRRVEELGLTENVLFQNRFVELRELCEYLGAADLYITPYLNEAQITSGTLAYALGAGNAVISTPYWYAEEMLAEDRGVLVPFHDSDAIAGAINDLLDNDTKRHAMRKRAYTFCRRMVWQRVAQDYLDVFNEARESWHERRRAGIARVGKETPYLRRELPEPDLRHLRALTDDTGIFQHCNYSTPDRHHGYCTDDVTRALIAAAMHWDQTHDNSVIPLMQTYLSFLAHALNEETGRFRNFMNFDRSWAEEVGSDDSHGRALWGLGVAVSLCPHESMIALATRQFKQGLPATEEFQYARSRAFTLMGVQAYLRRFGGDSEARRLRALLAERLADAFTSHMSDDWPWLEDAVTYANAKLPHALISCGKWMQRGEWIEMGLKSLEWLCNVQTNENGHLSIIGNDGWYVRGKQPARFDQQCIEAHSLVEACIEAYHVTREQKWVDEAWKAFNWFVGDNDVRSPLYDFTTGGCRDGLQPDGVNENQGAESTLAWLISLLHMHNLQDELALEQQAGETPRERPVRKPAQSTGPIG